MNKKREEFLEGREQQAKRALQDLSRRWSTNPNVYYVLLMIALLAILVLVYI